MTTLEIAALIATYALAASRLLTMTRPLWDRLPHWAQLLLPVLLISLPQLAGALGLVHTKLDLVEAVGQAVVAVLIAIRGDAPKAAVAAFVLVLSLGLPACMSPHEGEHFNVAGIDIEGMAWRVDCALDNPETFYERWEYQNPNACAAELEPDETYSMCEEWMRVRYRYEWAKVEWLEKCGQAS